MKKVFCLIFVLLTVNEMFSQSAWATFLLQDSICEGSTINLTANSGSISVTGYTWDATPSGPFISSPNTSVTPIIFNTAGNYTVSLTAVSGTNTSYFMDSIRVLPTPTVTGDSPFWTICPPGTAQGMLFCNGYGASTYTWMPGFVVAAQLTLNPYPSVTTTYTVTGTAPNGCTNYTTVVVQVHPQIPIYVSGPTTVCDGVTNCFSMTMGFGGNMYFGIYGPCGFNDPNPTPCFTLGLGCGGTFTAYCNGNESPYSCVHPTTFNINVSTCTEINEIEIDNFSFEIIPNPFTDKLNIKKSYSEKENTQLEIIDVSGRVVSRSMCNFGPDAVYSMDVSELSLGIYFARIISGDQISKPIKIVKE